MKVLIDTSPLDNQNAGRGVGRYTKELIEALRRVSPENVFLSTSESKGESVDLIHYPFFDLYFWTMPLFPQRPTVVTIHDVTPLVFAKHYPPGIRGRLKFLLQKFALKHVKHVITDSAISKRDIIEKLRVASEKITVVPLAASSQIQKPLQAVIERVRKKYEIPKNYLLYVGDINYNKNLPFLISVMRRFPKLTLVLVGKNVANTSIPEGRAIAKAIRALGSEKSVRLLTQIESSSMEELSALYAGAQAYVQPSLYEGFGLPVLEAMQCRVPVVSSLGGSLPEVAGDHAFFFHPHDEDECASAITKALKMTGRTRAQHIQAAQQWASEYNWERTARETLAVYQKVVS